MFKQPGGGNIVVGLAGQSFKVPINIVRLKINEGDESKAAVKAFGLPDEEETNFVSWPETEIHDNVIYSPSARQSSIALKHWRYNKHPHLVLSIVDSRVYRISSFRKRDIMAEFDAYRAWANGNE